MTTEYVVIPFGAPSYWSSITFTHLYAQVVTENTVNILDIETAHQLLSFCQDRPDQFQVEVVA